MKVLWLCNVIIPQIAEKIGTESGVTGGWLNQLAEFVDNNKDIELCICAPLESREMISDIGILGNSRFFSFTKNFDEFIRFKYILDNFKPDIVHIFGTEFRHTLSMVSAFNQPNKTVIHIQGMVSIYERHYRGYLDSTALSKLNLRELIKKDSIKNQQAQFFTRGKDEIQAIRMVKHIMGRTDWDEFCTYQINPEAEYHFVQEMLRKSFYKDRWSYDNCEKHSIFVSQASYPIKGGHILFEAVGIVKRFFPNVKLYIAGYSPVRGNTLVERLKESAYSKYMKKLINKYDLASNIIWTGNLIEEEMKERYLQANVFVSASIIENSSNSIGEALLLGVPVISSYVGGVMSLAEHGVSALFYPADEPYMLAGYIIKLFENNDYTNKLSQNAKAMAERLYDREHILESIMNAYNEIYNF